MKRILVLTAAFACAGSVHAQGQIQFTTALSGANVVPPTSSANTGQGTFALEGTLFQGGVMVRGTTPSTGARIHGAAPVGNNADALFDMGGPTFVAPDPTTGDPGGLFFDINRTLTTTEVNDLMGGLWYVNVRSDAFPNGDIRGQISVVPEPSTLILAALGTAALLLIRRRESAAVTTALVLLSLGMLFAPAHAGEVTYGTMTTVGPVAVVPDGRSTGPGTPWVGPWADRPVTGNEPANSGTIVVAVPPGWSLIANPLYHNRGETVADAVPDNTAGELFKRVPRGTVLLKFDNAVQCFSRNVFVGRRWSNAKQTLLPGEGAFIFNPTRQPFAVTFTGNCMYGGSVSVTSGLSLISSPDCGTINFAPLVWPPPEGCGPTPCGPVPPYWWASLAFDPQEGDTVYTFDSASDRFRVHHFQDGAWDHVPVVGAGESCFTQTVKPREIRWIGEMPL